MANAEEGTMMSSRALMIGLSMALITVSVLAAYLVLSSDNAAEPQILRAETEPYKVRPADPGGKKLDNLNSPMMGLLEKGDAVADGTEVLLPPEEEPELPPIAVNPEKDNQVTANDLATTDDGPIDLAATLTSETATTDVAEAAETEQPAEAEINAEETVVETAPVEAVAASEIAATAAEAAPEQETAVENIDDAVDQVLRPEPKPKIRPVVATGDNTFFVQFAAFRLEKSARETAALLTTKHAQRLDGMILGFMRRGSYWRVVSDPMPREDAAALCRVFVSVGQDCIVKSLD